MTNKIKKENCKVDITMFAIDDIGLFLFVKEDINYDEIGNEHGYRVFLFSPDYKDIMTVIAFDPNSHNFQGGKSQAIRIKNPDGGYTWKNFGAFSYTIDIKKTPDGLYSYKDAYEKGSKKYKFEKTNEILS